MIARRAFSVAVYARREDRVLVIEHRRLKTWLPIGGELEAGETPLEAAIRELREETGIAGEFLSLAGAACGVRQHRVYRHARRLRQIRARRRGKVGQGGQIRRRQAGVSIIARRKTHGIGCR